MPPDRAALLARLPDAPRWVELRALLLKGRGEILGFCPKPFAAAVADAAYRSAFVAGRPSFAAMGEALAMAGPGAILMTPTDSVAWARRAFPELVAERAILHQLSGGGAGTEARPRGVRHLAPGEVETLTLPPALQDELRAAAAGGTPIAAALADGVPVAFCYAGSITESLWDVSIDTLESWRRRGYAARAARFEIERFRALGRQPVWGAVESNGPSRGLARKLGFTPVEELWILSTPPLNPPA